MAQITDFLQTSDGDLDLSRGLRKCPDRATFVRQKIAKSVQFWQGENKRDLREGVPYDRIVFGQKFDRPLLTDLYFDMLANTTGVGVVRALTIGYDNARRELVVNVEAETDTGEDVSGPYIIARAEEI